MKTVCLSKQAAAALVLAAVALSAGNAEAESSPPTGQPGAEQATNIGAVFQAIRVKSAQFRCWDSLGTWLQGLRCSPAGQPPSPAADQSSQTPSGEDPAVAGKKRVSPTSYRVLWPTFLTDEYFVHHRAEIESLLLEQTPENRGYGSENCHRIGTKVAEMKTMLKDRIHDTAPMDYLASKKFLETLAFEAKFPAGPDFRALASN